MNEALAAHVPPGIKEMRDIAYSADSPRTRLDVYHPPAACTSVTCLPTIVWVHGGGFISGDKAQVSNYLRILASKGYTVVGVGYDIAPGSQYPTPVRQVNEALAYVVSNADALRADPSRIVLAGDSAGAQIAAQVALVISDAAYAARVGIVPQLSREALKGVVLHCGFHDPENIKMHGAAGGFLQATGWAYFGRKDFQRDPRLHEMSIVRNVGTGFPPMFISVGNADGLAPHSMALADKARALGVDVDSLFFAADHHPPLAHEYQFDLGTAAGREALDRTFGFLARVTVPPPS
ncbi:MAG: alpha/beta hydrolase [Hyphomicrobium sp.]|nr:alpha/beta hydrolase [Hyphomicrobium sp.]